MSSGVLQIQRYNEKQHYLIIPVMKVIVFCVFVFAFMSSNSRDFIECPSLVFNEL